eukprot:765160-Hanusia_phi.AAC.1
MSDSAMHVADVVERLTLVFDWQTSDYHRRHAGCVPEKILPCVRKEIFRFLHRDVQGSAANQQVRYLPVPASPFDVVLFGS